MIRRRGFVAGLAAALAAPAIIRTSGLLMPVKPVRILRIPVILREGMKGWQASYADLNGQWLEAREGLPELRGEAVFNLADEDVDAALLRQRLLKQLHEEEARIAQAFL